MSADDTRPAEGAGFPSTAGFPNTTGFPSTTEAVTFRGVVAIDGPSGTGKSTVSRQLALRLGARYLDTGAMYRAATLAVLESSVPIEDIASVVAVVNRATIVVTTDPHNAHVLLDSRQVDAEIRSADVTAAVSAVSAIPAVRAQLVAAQRSLIGAGGIVVEGRDIGTVVWPAARPKIYLTAQPGIRARRRANQLGADALVEIEAGLARRDQLDSTRAASPLVAAVDAVEVDTTDLNIGEVVQRLVDMTMMTADCG